MNLKVMLAIDEINKMVTEQYQKASDQRWQGEREVRRAEKAMREAQKTAGKTLRRYIRSKLRPHRVEIGSRFYDCDHSTRPPTPHVSLHLKMFLNSPGCRDRARLTLYVDLWPLTLPELDRYIERVKGIADAHAVILKKQEKEKADDRPTAT